MNLNLIFRVYTLISHFLAESLKHNKTSKKDHSFYNTVSLKNLTHFYDEPQLPQHCEKYILATHRKTLLTYS